MTGGSRGIGRAIALEIARAGARVALNYLRNRLTAEGEKEAEEAEEAEDLGEQEV